MITGSIVALVTPMHPDGAIDWSALARLIEYHIESGTAGLGVVGTTGESPTLTVP
ncbi:MAG: dihydrodipicolinate synthase family protein, partial [Pseudomonadota bacterium]|nr:dihydrodipicolinate synthase family protein [Pseudomonadota bacterium]